MKAIHVLRKPCSEGTVAANVLKYGCGAINVDACRVGTDGGTKAVNFVAKDDRRLVRWDEGHRGKRNDIDDIGKGRWPANVVFQHAPGCVRVGSQKVKGQNPKYANEGRGAGKGEGVYESGVGPRPAGIGIGHADADGTETVTVYECAPGCPVAALDEQSGVSKSTGGKFSGTNALGQDSGWNAHNNRPVEINRPTDTGGASRYFKQFVGSVRSEDR